MPKLIPILLSFLLSIFAASALALSVVDANDCDLVDAQKPFILVLKIGDDLTQSVLYCAEKAHIKSASLSGIGMLDQPVLAYYDMQDKRYREKLFLGNFELVSLQGNLTEMNQKPFAHIHVVLADKSYHAIGGHLDTAKVGATAEITVLPFDGSIYRKTDQEMKLKLIDTKK